MKKPKYEKVMVIDGASITPWTVKEIMKELTKQNKYVDDGIKRMKGNELIEMPSIKNEYGNTHFHLQVYRWEEVK